MSDIKHVDCTLRDGGYYNNWDFSKELTEDYLYAMNAIAVDFVELGFRSFDIKSGFKGAFAYTTDNLIRSLKIPEGLKIGVMVNASEVVTHDLGPVEASKLLFSPKQDSPVTLIRFACHLHEFEETLKACSWLKSVGYIVGMNLMQSVDRTSDELDNIAKLASQHSIDVLYFADSLGSMYPEHCVQMIKILRQSWKSELGIHTHDNMGKGLINTMIALDEGVTWIDSTVTGMGRGAGNAQTELLAIELEKNQDKSISLVPLLSLIDNYFTPLKQKYAWGMNSYYYLAGKHGIHPSYIQEMLSDSRYKPDDILAVIAYLREKGGNKFQIGILNDARQFFQGEPRGGWEPADLFKGREILILGAGPSVLKHRSALENYIGQAKPLVLALNTQSQIKSELIDYRVACHPIRLLADCETHCNLAQPLITPLSMLPEDIQHALGSKEVLDFGLGIASREFIFHDVFCHIPAPLVIAYALAVATSGQGKRILLAGFDGYGADDPRTTEMENLLSLYNASHGSIELISITPTRYGVPTHSVYAMGM